MANLKTNYLGLELKNPIIVGASNLVNDTATMKLLEEAGASAVVYKTLFEEQIQLEALEQEQGISDWSERHAEMTSIFPLLQHAGPKEFLYNLEKAKKSLSIPLIASINAVSHKTWVEYAQLVEKTGVDAIELNLYSLPQDLKQDGHELLLEQYEIIKEIIAAVKIPVSVKLSPYYANPLHVISEMDALGIQGIVLFNRYFQPEINIKTEEHSYPLNLSSPGDNKYSLRYTGILHQKIKANICTATGIHSGEDVIKMLLAGTDCTQVVSAIYKHKPEHISKMLRDIEEWMALKHYASIDDFKGKLAQKNLTDPYAYKRAHYVDILMNSDDVLHRYPMV